MSPDFGDVLSILISLGILGLLGFVVRQIFTVREDVRAIKTTLGINGSGPGLVQEVAMLRQRNHDHSNDLTVLMTERDLRRGTA